MSDDATARALEAYSKLKYMIRIITELDDSVDSHIITPNDVLVYKELSTLSELLLSNSNNGSTVQEEIYSFFLSKSETMLKKYEAMISSHQIYTGEG